MYQDGVAIADRALFPAPRSIRIVPMLSYLMKAADLTPSSLSQAEQAGAFDPDANILDLRPDASIFVNYLNFLDRTDIASEIFVRLLEAYRENKNGKEREMGREEDTMRYVLSD